MLTKLAIENVALVERAQLEFGSGLSVLTGETGAGKSIVVTGLALALGCRAEREFIRHGTEQARVEATFDFGDTRNRCGQLQVARVISRDAASRVQMNGQPSSVTAIRQALAPAAEIVGQHAGQMLMNEEHHLSFLDDFAGLTPQREELSEIHERWQRTRGRLRNVMADREQLIRERELLEFQKREIEQARIRAGEEETLLRERKRLDSARALMASAGMIQEIIDGEDRSLMQLLSAAKKELEKAAAIDVELEKQVDALSALSYEVEEIRRFMEQYGAGIEDNPKRLEEINLRLDEIYQIKKKYGGSEQAVLHTLERIRRRLSERPQVTHVIGELERETETLRQQYTQKALALSAARHKAAARLRQGVIRELKQLAIHSCNFDFEFICEDDPDGVILGDRPVRPMAYGLESGRFLFSANPGEPLKSLVRTASGGELSRVLLALKSIQGSKTRGLRPLLVFDEVDAGIGGHTATQVGKKLKKLSEDCQLLVITHLHQIARLADHHYVAQKTVDGGRSTITVRELTKAEVSAELERMVALPEGVE